MMIDNMITKSQQIKEYTTYFINLSDSNTQKMNESLQISVILFKINYSIIF